MSYYGYPNPQAYNANYQAYAAAYAANGGASFDQYQAYNAAAYRAMQQQAVPSQSTAVQPPPPPPPIQQTTAKPSASISQPAQRYDYSVMPAAAQPGPQTNYDPTYASNMMQMQRTPQQAKWNSMLAAANGTNAKKTSNFQRNRGNRNPGGQAVQIFYCEVCKISCAGPQTYKEHLDGQKHKKREQASKLSSEQVAQPTPSNTSPNQNWKRGRNQQNFSRNSVVIKCELCDVACTGRDAYSAHVRGMKHQKTLKLHQKLGKPIPPDALDILQAAANVTKTITPTTTISAPVPYPQPNVVTAPAIVTVNRPPLLNKPIVQPMATDLEPEMNLNPQLDDQNIDQDEQINIEPIGREYIETRLEGKILSFFCKLCECQFNDPNAKDMHTKGRRHRLAYKKKVDPSLRVDMKTSSNNSSMSRNKLLRERNLNTRRVASPLLDTSATVNTATATNIMPLMSASIPDATQPATQQTIQQLMSQPLKAPANNGNYNWSYNANNFQTMRQGESFDDRHIIAKHNQIYPSQEEINAIQEIVNSTEKALKLVSDQIAEEDMLSGKKVDSDQTPKTVESKPSELSTTPEQSTTSDRTTTPEPNDQSGNQMFRALKGVMRVGLLAKGLLLKGDTDVQLIVLCADKPTKRLLGRVYSILLQKIDIVSPQIKYSVILDKQAETIVIIKTTISDLQPLITCKVLLTSPAVRTFSEQLADQQQQNEQIKTELTIINNNNNNKEDNDDLLDKQRCLDSLASLRHSKWFQARASNVQNCVVIIRILRDLCRRNPTWTPLSQWGLELLVERSLSSSNQPLSPGEALRRVLECVSSGVLLPNGCGLYDPCEKDATDVSDTLKNQQREELTSSAQMALRLLAFKQIHKILGMECLSTPSSSSSSNAQTNRLAKKRQHQSNGNDNQVEEKKDKKDPDQAEMPCEPVVEIKMELNI